MKTLNDLEKLTAKGKAFWEETSSLDESEYGGDACLSYLDLMQLNNYNFLREIIDASNRNELNEVVEKFPAYDIAVNCLKSGHLTIKQRAAITNIFLYAQLSRITTFIMDCAPW